HTSGADDILRRLPHGHNTILSRKFHNGHDLSGGQWQRIGIARATYRNAPLLIADEPTAALAPHAEARALTALTPANPHHRTTILITHRLNTIHHADRIIVLSHGRIAETGTHHHLLTHNGIYR